MKLKEMSKVEMADWVKQGTWRTRRMRLGRVNRILRDREGIRGEDELFSILYPGR